MDAEGYLKKHGWRGSGHSLDTNNKGLRKPLLISKKVDVLGVGINKHDVIADQWWMKAFDSSLKDFGTGKKSLLSQVREHGVKRGGLYARFVQGEGVPGTIGKVEPQVAAVAVNVVNGEAKGIKRKANGSEDEEQTKRQKKDKKKRNKSSSDSSSSDDEKKQRRAAKKEAKAKKQKDDKTLDGLPEDKRKQYEERAAAKGLTVEQYFTLRLAKNLTAKEARRSGTTTPASEPVSEDSESQKRKKEKKDKKSSKK